MQGKCILVFDEKKGNEFSQFNIVKSIQLEGRKFTDTPLMIKNLITMTS